MDISKLIEQAWRDATNCYLAGAGLPPLKESSPEENSSEAPLIEGDRDVREGSRRQVTGGDTNIVPLRRPA